MEREPKKPTAEELLGTVANQPLPFDDEAEKGILSCLLQEPSRISDVRAKLLPEALYHLANEIVYEALLAMDGASPPMPIDVISLTHRLREDGNLDRVGGAAAISELFAFVPIPAHYPFYLKIVLEKWTLRRVINASAENIHAAKDFGRDNVQADIAEFVSSAESRIFSVLEATQNLGEHSTGPVRASKGVMAWVEHMTQVIDNRGKVMGLTTGIHELDVTLHGLDDAQGETMVLAGRPGQGKTSLGMDIGEHLAVGCNIPGAIFSAEMKANQLYTRLVLGRAKVDTAKAHTGMFSRGDEQAMQVQAAKVQRAPLWISDGAAITTADIRAQTQVLKRQHGIRWIMIDHLHLIKAVSAAGQKDERMRLVEVMETLQFLKKQHNLVVFALVQLSRETDRAAGKPPVLADLSGSAAIEQYADHVVMIHRDPYFFPWHTLSEEKQKAWRELIAPRRERSPELWSDGRKYDEQDGGFARQDYEESATLYVRKNRRGPTPDLRIRFEPEYTRFSTRMPSRNSSNPLDWQLGTYHVAKRSHGPKHVAKSAIYISPRPKDDPNWHEDFTAES